MVRLLVEACSDKEKLQKIFGEPMDFPPEPGNPWKFGKLGMGKLSPNNSQLLAAISRKTRWVMEGTRHGEAGYFGHAERQAEIPFTVAL